MPIAPYGSWGSPITSDTVTTNSLRLGQIDVDHDFFYYVEGRASEKGRSVLMKGDLNGYLEEVLPQQFNVRSSVHVYGGKCFSVKNDTVYFVNHADGAIYKKTSDGMITQLTQAPNFYFADFTISKDYLYAVAEEHIENTVNNMLIRLDLTTYKIDVIASGYDFYAAPRLSQDDSKLAWLCWNHPNMPWDGSELWVAVVTSQGLTSPLCVAGNDKESITHPVWSENTLYFTSDRSGFWNLYRYQNHKIDPIYPSHSDFGAAHWIFGSERYTFMKDGSIAAISTELAIDCLYLINLKTKTAKRLNAPFTTLSDLYVIKDTLIMSAASPTCATTLIAFNIETETYTLLKSSQPLSVDEKYISFPKSIQFPTENNTLSYGFYYPPTNPDYKPLADELPPLILRCHGGPTTHVSPKLNLDTLFFTSRGFAVFEINYGGSTGYGRSYRNRLKGNWGVVDRLDCIHAANYLCSKGLADKNRLAIKGGSAGGYTVLCTLAFNKLFQAGVSYYGVCDLEDLTKDTHKMEKHYLDSLIGPYPKEQKLYKERSPIYFANQITSSVLLFQGDQDPVVPPSQSQKIYESLLKEHTPVAYILFENEGHGFKMSSTIKRCLEEELSFYQKLFYKNTMN